MKKVLISLCAAVILALISGCGGGGGGGGGVTPPSPSDVSRLFPLQQGQSQAYDATETEHSYVKTTTSLVSLAKRGIEMGPLNFIIPLPKLAPFKTQRNTTHTYETTTDRTATGTDVHTIIGTHSGDPFPPGTTTFIEEVYGQRNFKEEYVVKEDGQIVAQGTHTWSSEMWDRSFWTNDNGLVRLWGKQHKDTDWGPIEPYDQPLVYFKADATSWTVGHIKEDFEEAVFSADVVANLVGQETITVPAGTFTCYKVVYKFTNVKLETAPQNVQVTSYNLTTTMTAWLALDKGLVKSTSQMSLTASFKDLQTGATGNITASSTSTKQLKPPPG